MSNFEYLKEQFPNISRSATKAEQQVLISPEASVVLGRSALEQAVIWMYENELSLSFPYNDNLSSLIHERSFRDIIGYSLFQEIRLIKDIGNNGAHGKRVSSYEATSSIKNLFRFLSYLGRYYGEPELRAPAFDMAHIPDGQEVKRTKKEMQALAIQLDEVNQKALNASKEKEELAETVKSLREELKAAQERATANRESREKEFPVEETIPHELPEAATRKLYIDILLKDAGWENLAKGKDLEYAVVGMPTSTNPSGKGSADYVLWGKDGKPLAVVEAKETMKDARRGKHQAFLYANCLEQMHGQRPVIFYTNGFETYIWDDTFGVERPIQGFYTQDELQRSIDRRKDRKDLRGFKANTNIAGRPYQLEAIQRVAENMAVSGSDGKLREAHRGSLLVMATGSGKTRTSAGLVDMLSKCNWAKRILFLADRNSLVTQAKKAFKEHLPELSAIDLTKEKEIVDSMTRLVFSTYGTIMNKIDAVKSGDARFYGVGSFDLIIIDEAHRSVYNKYSAIFDYFDASLIGLTATPKKEIDFNTYGLFGIEDDNPTFAYELDTAVKEKFLVPSKSLSVPLKFQRDGIKYKELSEKEKLEYEEKFGDPTNHGAPDEIGSSALNKWLFNTDTVDKVLNHLMTDGIRVEGGDKLGKTIIFAKNHDHAVFIEQRFNKNYPEFGGHFLRVIDNYESKAQDLLESFVNPLQEENPQIAVSVDMMDTGVDAPRVVNLVFFKQVKSVTKFWQMIGRGTRLCSDLFAPGEDKKEFLILDYCENFEFFDENPDGLTSGNQKPLLQQIFETRLEVAMLISELDDVIDEDKEIRDQFFSLLYTTVAGLDRTRFVVKKELRYVVKYSKPEAWQNLDKSDAEEIRTHLSHLEPSVSKGNEMARRFDLLTLKLQIARLSVVISESPLIRKIIRIASALQKKDNIPQVKESLSVLKEVQKEDFWKVANAKNIEKVRTTMRDLMIYLDKDNQAPVFTHFEDELDLEGIVAREPISQYGRLQSYKDRVESYVRNNRHHLSIDKLSKNIPITGADLLALEEILFTEDGAANKEKFVEEYGEQPLGTFIRSIIGLDQEATQRAFAGFIQSGKLEADQITFINSIVTHLTKNGMMKDKGILFESPFTNIHYEGLTGVFKKEADVISLVKIIDEINGNAQVG